MIFFNNSGYGHVRAWHYRADRFAGALGRIHVGRHLIETPVGPVNATLHEDGSVTVENVAAYRYRRRYGLRWRVTGR